MDLTKMKAPKGQENLKDALGNFVYQQPDESLESKLAPSALSKKELREQKKEAEKNAPKPKELKGEKGLGAYWRGELRCIDSTSRKEIRGVLGTGNGENAEG
ncbi:uncharacterized protein PAC_11171 [Phialocephala subalpina]|uniref:Uncharacterized protein n=1 Tax=Phialocephala subalpina TaxID=576137 RepID=A0A1L7X8C1_9HELO|nr:uncharacterized protein PAC_11171 [Phialocephala subalpina]